MVEALLDERARFAVGRLRLADLLELVEGALRVTEPREEERREAEAKRGGIAPAGALDAAPEQVREVLPALLRRVERVERERRLVVIGREDEDPLVVGDRFHGIAGDLFGDDADLGEEIGLPLRALGCHDHALVERLEIAPQIARREDLLQAQERAIVRRILCEDALEIRLRFVDVAEVLVVERGRALGEVHLDRGGQTSLTGLGDRLGERLEERLRPPDLERDHREAIPEIELGRMLDRRARKDVEGAAPVVQVLLHRREAKMEREAIRLRRRGREQDAEHLRLLVELAVVGVGLLEHRRRFFARLRERQHLLDENNDLRVFRREIERARRGGERLPRILQRAEIELREIELALDAGLPLREVALALERLRGAVGIALGEMNARERTERRHVLRLAFEQVFVDHDRAPGLAEDVLFELRPFEEDCARFVRRCALDAKLEQPAEVVLALRLRAEQAIERGDGVVVAWVRLDEVAVGVDGVVGRAGVLRGDLRELHPQRALLFRRGVGGVDAVLNRFGEHRPFAGDAGKVLERLQRLRIARRELVRLPRPAHRRDLVREAIADDGGELSVERALVERVLGVREEHLVERRQMRPLPFALVDRHERGRGALVVRLHTEDTLVRAERTIGRAELVLEDAGGAVGQRDLLRRVLLAIGGVRQHLGEAFEVLRRGVEVGERFEVVRADVGFAERAQRARVKPGARSSTAAATSSGTRLGSRGALHRRCRASGARRSWSAGLPISVDAPLHHGRDGREILVALRLLLERVERGRVARLFFEDEAIDAGGIGAAVEPVVEAIFAISAQSARPAPRRTCSSSSLASPSRRS